MMLALVIVACTLLLLASFNVPTGPVSIGWLGLFFWFLTGGRYSCGCLAFGLIFPLESFLPLCLRRFARIWSRRREPSSVLPSRA